MVPIFIQNLIHEVKNNQKPADSLTEIRDTSNLGGTGGSHELRCVLKNTLYFSFVLFGPLWLKSVLYFFNILTETELFSSNKSYYPQNTQTAAWIYLKLFPTRVLPKEGLGVPAMGNYLLFSSGPDRNRFYFLMLNFLLLTKNQQRLPNGRNAMSLSSAILNRNQVVGFW